VYLIVTPPNDLAKKTKKKNTADKNNLTAIVGIPKSNASQ
jgi:hypothetical protein